MGYNDVGAPQKEVLPKLLEHHPVFYNDASGREAQIWAAEAQKYGYDLEQVGWIGPDPLYQFFKQGMNE